MKKEQNNKGRKIPPGEKTPLKKKNSMGGKETNGNRGRRIEQKEVEIMNREKGAVPKKTLFGTIGPALAWRC